MNKNFMMRYQYVMMIKFPSGTEEETEIKKIIIRN